MVILAAGASTRMGSPKQLLDYRGQPLLRHAAQVALASCCEQVIVVLGANSASLRPTLAGLPVITMENPDWQAGMGTSIKAGIEIAVKHDLDGVILGLADQPLVDTGILDALVQHHLDSRLPIVTSEYAGTVGVPVFFASKYFPNLMALEPTQGCKGVILKHSDEAARIACQEAEIDIDTKADYDLVRS